ncbi:D-alanine--poly(phosphoribitol) ligase [Actinosynnema sp. ALI-1.44]|uniref:AMP-binding protein n=1 Tax=Actinosynnema sp. ALI-1.44 TaxID=1933779 RepID=UPI00097BEDA1|nr:AMP-binding protein [Actinosynnema sp. ALI-1.44]ONI83206.1 D-alanine--poly(phosphoribitol) ligase [Actinosynnema sp. ALI-1.44]
MTHALQARFLHGLAVSGDGAALRVDGHDISYTRAHQLALAWAGDLLARCGQAPAAVGVLANKSAEAYIGVLAALYVGAAVVPLHPEFPAVRNLAAIEAAGVRALIVDEQGAKALPGLAVDLPVLVPGGEPVGPPLAEPASAEPGDTAYILFTSGSTGRPKGVRITHGNTAHYFRLLAERYDFGPADRFSQTFDLTFDCALFDLFAAWDAGATAVALPSSALLSLPAFLAEEGITVWFSVPSVISYVRKAGVLEPGALSGLRWSFFAGEALKTGDAADWSVAAPASKVENLYGPTELTVTITGYRWDGAVEVNGVVPIGAVHPGHEYRLRAADGTTAADEGELCVTGPQLTGGYLDPADEQGRFEDVDGKRWYRTGDRVRRLDGDVLGYLGRADSQIQLHGWRVELGEIDHRVRECPGVDDAVTLFTGDALIVFYTGLPQRPLALAALLRRSLPEQLVPRQYRHLAEFPLNPNRKIDRPALLDSVSAQGGRARAHHKEEVR